MFRTDMRRLRLLDLVISNRTRWVKSSERRMSYLPLDSSRQYLMGAINETLVVRVGHSWPDDGILFASLLETQRRPDDC